MRNILSSAAFKSLIREKENMECKSIDNSSRTVFDKYSATEKFEDIINTLKAIYFKLELAEQKRLPIMRN